ncbi:MAG: DNA polymerase, partial [bacterium]
RLTGPNPELPGTKMLLQIHDELVFETPTATAEATRTLVTQRMEQAMTLSVPIKVDASVSSNWFDG